MIPPGFFIIRTHTNEYLHFNREGIIVLEDIGGHRMYIRASDASGKVWSVICQLILQGIESETDAIRETRILNEIGTVMHA